MRCLLHVLVASTILMHQIARADFYFTGSFSGWQTVVDGQYTTIDFTGFPIFTPIFDQYAELGVIFPDADDVALPGYPIDGWGLDTSAFDDTITVLFTQPQRWIAVHHPGDVQMAFYHGEEFLFEDFPTGSGGDGWFHGIVTDLFFDKVVITDPFGDSFGIDNLYFGGAVPAPAGLALLALSVVSMRRRHRT